jgi:hypothetical protein
MHPSTVRLLTTATCAAAAIAVVAVTGAEASNRHIRKHHQRTHLGWNESLASGEVRRVAPSYTPGDVCPGIARAIDCRIWPPPFADDSDRKQGDGGE